MSARVGPPPERLGFNYDEDGENQRRVLTILRLLEPFDVQGLGKVRLGRPHDGGYVMLDDFGPVRAAYSVGINDDVSWDTAMAGFGIDIFQYDHTIDALPEPNPRFHWQKVGLAPAPADAMKTLPDLIRENGHENDHDLVLKLDIEGAEWDVLPALPPGCLDQFRQIVIEVHGL